MFVNTPLSVLLGIPKINEWSLMTVFSRSIIKPGIGIGIGIFSGIAPLTAPPSVLAIASMGGGASILHTFTYTLSIAPQCRVMLFGNLEFYIIPSHFRISNVCYK